MFSRCLDGWMSWGRGSDPNFGRRKFYIFDYRKNLRPIGRYYLQGLKDSDVRFVLIRLGVLERRYL